MPHRDHFGGGVAEKSGAVEADQKLRRQIERSQVVDLLHSSNHNEFGPQDKSGPHLPNWVSKVPNLRDAMQAIRPPLTAWIQVAWPIRRRFPLCSAGHSTVRMSSSAVRNSDPNAVAVVVGGSRGIGLAMTQALVTRGWRGKIVATGRDVGNAPALGALWQFMPDRFAMLDMDVCEEDSIESAAKEVKDWGEGRVDLLIHCAGVLHEDGNMPETSLARVRKEFLRRNLEINLMGPVLVAKHFSPMMITARKKDRVPSVLAALSARVGSIEDNGLGGWLSYRASKAGQNQALKTMSIELGRRGIICVSLHPGTVATDLSAPFRKNVKAEKLFEADRAAGMLLDVVDSLQEEDNGKFLAYDRSVIPY